MYGRIILYSKPDEKAQRKVSGDPDCLKRSPASKMVTQGFCSCNTQTFHFLLNICNSHVVPVSYLIGTTGQIPKCNILCIFFRKIIAKIKKTSPPHPQMNTGGSVRWRKAAVFNWLVLEAIFENLKYKILSLSNRAGVFQQTYLHSAKVNVRSGGNGKTTLPPKKPKQLPSWYSVWPCKECKNWEPKPGFLLMNFKWLLIFLNSW